jgi:hypothetical protein
MNPGLGCPITHGLGKPSQGRITSNVTRRCTIPVRFAPMTDTEGAFIDDG